MYGLSLWGPLDMHRTDRAFPCYAVKPAFPRQLFTEQLLSPTACLPVMVPVIVDLLIMWVRCTSINLCSISN